MIKRWISVAFWGSTMLFLFIINAQAAIYYVSPTGSNTQPYDTWEKAANLPSTAVSAGNGMSGPHTMYIAPATYPGSISLTNANWNGGAIVGTAAHGSTAAAEKKQVWLSASSDIAFRCQRNNVTLSNLSITSTSLDGIYYDGTNLTVNNVYIYNTGRQSVNIAGGINFTINRSLFEGSAWENGIVISSEGSGTFNYCIIRRSTTMLMGSANWGAALCNIGRGAVVLNNCNVMGSGGYGLRNSSAGSIEANNCIVQAGKRMEGQAVRNDATGTFTTNNCLLIGSGFSFQPTDAERQVYGTVIQNNNLSGIIAPKFIHPQRKGYIVPCVDDGGYLSYAESLNVGFRDRGISGTYFVEGRYFPLNPRFKALSDAFWSQTGNVKVGMEIGYHSWSHSMLSKTDGAPIFTITKAGKKININRVENTITLLDSTNAIKIKTITGFRTKTLDQIKTAIENTTSGFGKGTVSYSNQYEITPQAFGEIIKDSDGDRSTTSGYSAAIYIPADPTSEGYLKSEIIDGKALAESDSGLNRTIYSFATPYGYLQDKTPMTAIAAGFWGERDGVSHSKGWSLDSIDIFNGGYLTWNWWSNPDKIPQDNWIRWMCEILTQEGGIFYLLSHNALENSVPDYLHMIDIIKSEYPQIKICSMYEAMNDIRNNGEWTTTDGRIYTRAWTDEADFHLQSTSPAIGAGKYVSLNYDYSGKPINVAVPDIGAYEYKLSPLSVNTTSADTSGSKPTLMCSPNPFNGVTTIRFTLPSGGETRIIIYNIMGQRVRTLMMGNIQAGQHNFIWNGKSNGGHGVSSGIYFVHLESGKTALTTSILHLK
jgi:hypothetical protein